MARARPRTGWQLRLYLGATQAARLAVPTVLRRRVRQGKEDPLRVDEKRGLSRALRPDGRLIWLHATGLGEVLALRGLIAVLSDRTDAAFLVTSSSRASADVFCANLPPRTQHQYLPLDTALYLRRFLDRWKPDLSVWTEQDLWPGAMVEIARRNIPAALVNARITPASLRRRMRVLPVYRDLLTRFDYLSAQSAGSAENLRALGGKDVRIAPSIKFASVPLAADAGRLAAARAALTGRRIWVAASTHAADEAVALDVQARLFAGDRSWLLILVPRAPLRSDVVPAVEARGLSFVTFSTGALPAGEAVLLADTFGDLGLWYRLATIALIGGSFDDTEGHNPWEAVVLGVPVLHGPRVGNFGTDYATLAAAGVARPVTAQSLEAALRCADLPDLARRCVDVARGGAAAIVPLADDLVALMARGAS